MDLEEIGCRQQEDDLSYMSDMGIRDKARTMLNRKPGKARHSGRDNRHAMKATRE
jgi:hypothetical protein